MDLVILCDESLESLSACWMDHGYLCAFFFIWLELMVWFLAVNNDRGRFSGHAGYRNENFRGRGNFSGGNFSVGGRNDFERRFDFSNRTRGNARRNEETGHRVYKNGGGKATRQASQGSMS